MLTYKHAAFHFTRHSLMDWTHVNYVHYYEVFPLVLMEPITVD